MMDSEWYRFFVLSSVVIHCANAWCDYPPCAIPVYIWCILGTISTLLLLLSIFLVFVLVKTKFLQKIICNKNKFIPIPEKEEEGNQTHTWQKKSMRRQNSDKIDGELKSEVENNQTLKRHDSAVTISEMNTMFAPKKLEGSSGVSPRIIKNVVRDMPIILPEQMSQICKEVLNRKNKSEDSKGSLQNIDQLVKEGKSEVKTELKYASTPALDLYDVPPTPQSTRKISTLKKNAVTDKDDSHKNNNTEENVVNGKRASSSSNTYDFPKEVNSNALEVSDIYDSPKSDKPSSLMQKQLHYVEAYFQTENVTDKFKKPEDKHNYAFLKELELAITPSKENMTNTDSETKRSGNSYEHYEIPNKSSEEETKMYINANDNTGSETKRSGNSYEHYEIPIKSSEEETKMYINANVNMFGD